VVYEDIERELLSMQLTHPRGDYDISLQNYSKWIKVLKQFLVDNDNMKAINRGTSSDNTCSNLCLEETGEKYQFVDTARFALNNCKHASHHI